MRDCIIVSRQLTRLSALFIRRRITDFSRLHLLLLFVALARIESTRVGGANARDIRASATMRGERLNRGRVDPLIPRAAINANLLRFASGIDDFWHEGKIRWGPPSALCTLATFRNRANTCAKGPAFAKRAKGYAPCDFNAVFDVAPGRLSASTAVRRCAAYSPAHKGPALCQIASRTPGACAGKHIPVWPDASTCPRVIPP